jgi:hypothetical protein
MVILNASTKQSENKNKTWNIDWILIIYVKQLYIYIRDYKKRIYYKQERRGILWNYLRSNYNGEHLSLNSYYVASWKY